MHRFATFAFAGALGAALLSTGCQNDHNTDTGTTRTTTTTSTTRASGTSSGYGADDDSAATASAKSKADKKADKRGGAAAHATIEPSKAPGQDDVRGVVHFTPAANGVRVHAEITGLEPNSKHGFHIHEKADLSDPELKSAGGHFNPGMHKHGGPGAAERHAGDLGNLEADAHGKANYDKTVEGITLDDSKTGIIGKSVIVHAKADDLKTDPAGDSGARIAGGVIERGAGK
jgi:Cu-Zn family superoxide dismutase